MIAAQNVEVVAFADNFYVEYAWDSLGARKCSRPNEVVVRRGSTVYG